MDDRRRRFAAGLLAICLLAASQTGCALFVMAGKMFFGDPVMPSAFEKRTKVNLAKSGKKVLVICTTPQIVKSELPAVDHDLMDGVSRRLRWHGISVVDRDQVRSWLDDNGGDWGPPEEIANRCDADYIVHIDLESFAFQDRNSPGLMQGRVTGVVRAYEVETIDGGKVATEVFEEAIQSTYPQHNPVSQDQISPRAFQQKFMDRLTTQLGQMLHSYQYSETIE
ncbi:MAG: hypothetical protein WD069_14670 [Planctomycetales bacterium]